MTSKGFLLSVVLLTIAIFNSAAQSFTSTINGKVLDTDSESPIAFASVVLPATSPQLGGFTDEKGEFKIENVPVGRYDIQIIADGYEPITINGIVVTSGKVQSVEVKLKESIKTMNEIVLKQTEEKEQPLNKMATVSARQLSVEEANKFAGGFDDPARLAASFAGVASNLTTNGIVIRGNAPKGLLWRMEGIEIPNPNHFGEIAGFGAGGITALSSQMMANSDFITGAFPAEYGNALSGVFDLSMRKGNSSKREHTLSIGTIGVDVSSEGPFRKDKPSSYLFNYRYSSLSLVDYLLPSDLGIKYQDISYKIHLPTKTAGVFSLWGIGFIDKQVNKPQRDSTKWKYGWEKNGGGNDIVTGVTGISHKYFLNDETYIKSTFAASSNKLNFEWNSLDRPLEEIYTGFSNLTLSTLINHKFNSVHTNKTGVIIQNLGYNVKLQTIENNGTALETVADDSGNSFLFQAYSQSSFRLGNKLYINPGFHIQSFLLTGKTSFEPRLGIKWEFVENQSLSFGYGKHSRIEKLNFYLTEVLTAKGLEQVNRKMDFTKAHHFVLGYDKMFGKKTHLKIEPYYQFLYDVPVIKDSSFSFLNLQYDWFVREKFINEGLGENFGIDVTLERFLNQGWYYLITSSVFDSKYTGGDGIWRNTAYNRNFIGNILVGKEWQVGKNKQNQISFSGKLTYMNGERRTPVDVDASLSSERIIYDYSQTFEEHAPSECFLHTTITYRRNKKHFSGLWSLQVMNALGTPQYFGYSYNYRDKSIDAIRETTIIPNLSYKIQF